VAGEEFYKQVAISYRIPLDYLVGNPMSSRAVGAEMRWKEKK
jgi:hypothetical protein